MAMNEELSEGAPYTFYRELAEQFLSAIRNRRPILPPNDRDGLLQLAAACTSCTRRATKGRNEEQFEAHDDDNLLIIECWADMTSMIANGNYDFSDEEQ